LLRKCFGKRAGYLKLATLGRYFGLGEEKHRALDDIRMNIEVFKKCTLTLFLESKQIDMTPPTVADAKDADADDVLVSNLSSLSIKGAKSNDNENDKDENHNGDHGEDMEDNEGKFVSPQKAGGTGEDSSKKSSAKKSSLKNQPLTPPKGLSSSSIAPSSPPIAFDSVLSFISTPLRQTTSDGGKPSPSLSTSSSSSSSSSPPNQKTSKKETPATPDAVESQAIVQQLEAAMGKLVYISYAGGSHSDTLRPLTPLRWVNRPRMFIALCGLSNKEKNFATRKVKEIKLGNN